MNNDVFKTKLTTFGSLSSASGTLVSMTKKIYANFIGKINTYLTKMTLVSMTQKNIG
jgi:hypothetical protein